MGIYGPGQDDDIVEHDGGPLRLPAWVPEWAPRWARRARSLTAPGWRPSRGAAIHGLAGLVVGLVTGYALGYRHVRQAGPPGAAAASAVAYPSGLGIVGLAGTEVAQATGSCSVQHGHELQLGVEVINESGTTVTLGQVTPVLPLGGLRAVSQRWGPCSALATAGAVPDDDVVGPGGTAWLNVTFQVLVACPGPLPVEFSVSYRAGTQAGTAQLPGFPDLGQVSYTGCGSN